MKKIWILPGIYVLITTLFLFDSLTAQSLNYIFPWTGYGGTFRYPILLGIDLYLFSYFIGLILTVWICIIRSGKYGYSKVQGTLIGIEIVLFGYLGAKLLYILEDYPKSLEIFSFGGVSFFGTVLLMPVALWVLSRFFKRSYGEFCDYVTPAGIAMLICIRTGCFLAGCCGSWIQRINGNPVILPVQLFECIGDIFILILILILERRGKWIGSLYFIFMASYSFLRFFLEFLRDTPKVWLGFSHGQVFAILSLIIAGFFFIKNQKCEAL